MNQVTKLIKKVKTTILTHQMLQKGDRVVVGVSGGPDSVCLLDVLCQFRDELNIGLIVAHYNHGLRPMEDQEEESFVKDLARQYGLPFIGDKAKGLNTGIPSLEERARNLRYEFLEKARRDFSAQKIALGHIMDDQAETVLMRLIRGSGLTGLAGIPPVRKHLVIRPLIECSRDEIVAYLRKRGLKWMVDSSNLATDFLRNKVRLEIMPLLRQYQPRVNQILSKTADILRIEDLWMEQEAEKCLSRLIIKRGEGQVSVKISDFLQVPDALMPRVVRGLIRLVKGNLRRITARHIKAICRMAQSRKAQGQVQLPDHIAAIKKYDILEITNIPDMGQEFFCYISGPGVTNLLVEGQKILLEEIIVSTGLPRLDESPWTGFFDARKVEFPLIMRNFRPGDAFVPLGMKGRKKVKDFFIDLKIPSSLRKSIPIFLTRDKIMWVCGLRIDDRFKVDSSTEKVLRIRFEGAVVNR